MARQRKLKVYRTPIGFHDAYVAASSQKAALDAWGTDANLFARGVAELVTDEELAREPLAHPGKVIKRSRGSIEEQLAALPPDERKSAANAPEGNAAAKPARHATKAAKPRIIAPRPSRAKLDKAEHALERLLEKQDAQEADLRRREHALAQERRSLEQRQERDRNTAEQAVKQAREDHSEAMNRWLESQ